MKNVVCAVVMALVTMVCSANAIAEKLEFIVSDKLDPSVGNVIVLRLIERMPEKHKFTESSEARDAMSGDFLVTIIKSNGEMASGLKKEDFRLVEREARLKYLKEHPERENHPVLGAYCDFKVEELEYQPGTYFILIHARKPEVKPDRVLPAFPLTFVVNGKSKNENGAFVVHYVVERF